MIFAIAPIEINQRLTPAANGSSPIASDLQSEAALATPDRYAPVTPEGISMDPPTQAPERLSPDQLRDRLTQPLAIGVLVEQPHIEVKTNVAGEIWANGAPVAQLQAGVADKAQFVAGKIALYDPTGRALGVYSGNLTVKPDTATTASGTPAAVAVNNHPYRGDMEIMVDPQTKAGLNAVNQVPLEQYLYGVVPSEMPASWPKEALMAQAVAARTYAVANLGRHSDRGFDLYSTTADQAYQGLADEASTSTQAVDATTGVVVTYEGQPINALFHSNSGGHTEDIKDVWGFNLPYMKGVTDYDQAAPRYHWIQDFTSAQVAAAVKHLGADVGQVTELHPASTTPFGRVSQLQVVGTTGTTVVDGNKFRLALGLYSTLYQPTPVNSPGQPLPTDFRFDGQGWGHGLGLSQYGARQLAANGENYKQILLHYYTGVALTTLV